MNLKNVFIILLETRIVWKNNCNLYLCQKGILYLWCFKNKPDALSIWNQKETQWVCSTSVSDTFGFSPCDREKSKILCVSIWRKTQRHWKCRSSFKLFWKGIWNPQGTKGFSQYGCVLINGRDPDLLRIPMADDITVSVRISWHWTAIKYILHRESEDFSCECHRHILCV